MTERTLDTQTNSTGRRLFALDAKVKRRTTLNEHHGNNTVINIVRKRENSNAKRTWKSERPPPFGGGLSRNPGGDLLSQGGTPKYHRRWWA
jgi:hypothetical protein